MIKALRKLCQKGMTPEIALLWMEQNPNNPKGELTLGKPVTDTDWQLVVAVFNISVDSLDGFSLDELRCTAAQYLGKGEQLLTNHLLQALDDFEYDTSLFVSSVKQEKGTPGSLQEIASLTAEVERLKRELTSAYQLQIARETLEKEKEMELQAAAVQFQTVRETLEKEKEMELQAAAAQFQTVRETLEKEKEMELRAAAAQFQAVRETLEKEKAIALQAAEEKNAQIAQMRLEALALREYLEQIEELQWENQNLTKYLEESRQEKAAFENLMAAACKKDVTYTMKDCGKKIKGCVLLEYRQEVPCWKFQTANGEHVVTFYVESITPETPPAKLEKMLVEKVEAPAPSESASPVRTSLSDTGRRDLLGDRTAAAASRRAVAIGV